jgi:Protein involved in biosynthesis of mitomycin antibiotics/polyketide fumonisin
VEPKISCSSEPAFRGQTCSVLARPVIFQTGKKRGSSGLAPGLLLLDQDHARGSSHCWCGLDDSTKENGCLQYIAGSQKWGLLPKPVIAGELQG